MVGKGAMLCGDQAGVSLRLRRKESRNGVETCGNGPISFIGMGAALSTAHPRPGCLGDKVKVGDEWGWGGTMRISVQSYEALGLANVQVGVYGVHMGPFRSGSSSTFS